MGQYKAKGAHFATLMGIGCNDESIELKLGQILALASVCEHLGSYVNPALPPSHLLGSGPVLR